MEPRMKNPAAILPGAWQAIVGLKDASSKAGVAQATLELMHLRASQINGCSACVVAGVDSARAAAVSDERVAAVAAWRDAPYFSEPERAALALTEAVTRLADRQDAVPDELWREVQGHYAEREVAALLLWIATTNVFNRLNASTRQVAGAGWS